MTASAREGFARDVSAREDRFLSRLETLRVVDERDHDLQSQIRSLAVAAKRELGEDSAVALDCERFMLAGLCRIQDLHTAAQQVADLVERCSRYLGEDHEVTLGAMWLRAMCLRRAADPGAIKEYRRVLDSWSVKAGATNRRTRTARLNLAVALREQGDVDSVREAAQIALREWQERLSEYGQGSGVPLFALSTFISSCLQLLRLGVPLEASERLETLASQLFQSRLALFGAVHRRTVHARVILADVLVARGRAREAVWMLYSCRAEQAVVSSDSPELLYTTLAGALLQTGRSKDAQEAVVVARQALTIAEKNYGPLARRVLEIRHFVAEAEAAAL